MKIIRSRGFTLVELLVVIAIIGILAAIVLSSMGSARTKANDASVKGSLHNVKTAGELYYLMNNGYGAAGSTAGSCAGPSAGSAMWTDSSSKMSGLISQIQSLVGSGNVDCGTSASAWSVAVKLPGGAYWCVDSIGHARGITAGGTAYSTALYGNAASPHATQGATTCN